VTSAPLPRPPQLSTVSESTQASRTAHRWPRTGDLRTLLAALLLLAGVAAITYGVWLREQWIGYATGGILLIVWTLFVVVDFQDDRG
jgi:hypothetical protein